VTTLRAHAETLVAIDELDDLMSRARPVPLTGEIRVLRTRPYGLADELRVVVRDDFRASRRSEEP